MGLPDEAEYWWDVKGWNRNGSRKPKHVFVHKKGLNCGHFHIHESKKIKNIDCHACIKILKEMHPNYEELINPTPKPPMYGLCSCGHARVKRINTFTKEAFLGCTHYPKCKITSKI